MEIVGIDFGTTNVRISVWDPEDQNYGLPRPIEIGRGLPYMPVVVALQKQENSSVSIVVGEDADVLEDNYNTIVIRDIKRWAQISDSKELQVKARFDVMGVSRPTNWNLIDSQDGKPGYIEAWGEHFQFVDLMGAILKEALKRANLPDEFEWRAGCPVHAGIEYRKWLNDLMTEFSGNSNLNWIADEPVLFMAFLRRMNLDAGSYLVYDLGGGSFDCALVEMLSDGDIIVYGADGHPLLGGTDVDSLLKQQFPNAPVNSLRSAKENVSLENPVAPIQAGSNLKWADVESALNKYKFIPRSLMALRDSYVSSKVVWGRREQDFPFGETIEENSEDDSEGDRTGKVRFIWQLNYDDIAKDMVEDEEGKIVLNKIILFGGPTRSQFFKNNLGRRFGSDKIIPTSDLLPGLDFAEMVALSMGACYFARGRYDYMVPSRLPINATLVGKEYGEIGYSAHQYFGAPNKNNSLFSPFESTILAQDKDNPQEYELTIATPDGSVLRKDSFSGFMEPGDRLTDERNRQPATSLRLIIDRLGFMFVEMKSEGVGLSWTKTFPVFPDPENDPPPWQTDAQRVAWQKLRERLDERAKNRKSRLLETLHNQPWRERGK